MKSLIKIALSLLFASLPCRVYASWGIGLNAGYWKMDTTELEKNISDDGDITRGFFNPDINFFYESAPKDGLIYGGSFGFGMPAGVKYEERTSWSSPGFAYTELYEVESTAKAIPILFYIKSRSGKEPYAWFGGAGVDYIMAKIAGKSELTGDLTGSDTFSITGNQLVPNITVGGEYFTGKNSSVGLNLKYVFSSEMEKLRCDYSGLRINLALRWYFEDAPVAAAPARKAEQVKPKRPSYLDDEVPDKPAPAAKPASSERQKLERQKLELEKEKLKLERERFEFEKQKAKEE
ncbi:MAG TPA: hypothetical protein DCL44_00820 [Elusimicrobia bacterium]|nr:hypothetical protein [Elusimicrobiota bacterium]